MDITLRPEFQLLDFQRCKLQSNMGVDQEFLRKVRDNILLCEHIAQTDIEYRVIFRTTHWWIKRASVFGLGMETKLLSAAPATKGYSANDRELLRSFGISTGEPPTDEDDWAPQ